MENILFVYPPEDVNYLPYLKSIFTSGARVSTLGKSSFIAVAEVLIHAKEKGCNKVVTCHSQLLALLLDKGKASLDDYAGSIFQRGETEILVVNPLDHLFKVPYGNFLYKRFVSKFTSKANWLDLPAFEWELFDPSKTNELLEFFGSCDFIAVDIETVRDDPDRSISCCGFTGAFIDPITSSYKLRTVVIPFDDLYNLQVAKVILESPVAKCLQNGKYDIAYFFRYGIAPVNYAFDTMTMFHCWYSELPKRLDFIAAFLLRDFQFWKDEGKSWNKMDHYRYNAKDCYATACCWIALMREIPDFAWRNYEIEFPLLFPCILAEHTGLKVDKEKMDAERSRFEASLEKQLAALRKYVGCDNYNPSSPQQTLKLFALLGCGDIKSSTPANRDKVAARHPLNKLIMKKLESYRKDRKLVTSYLRDHDPKEDSYKLWNGRVFYALNPHGTDTARLASKESQFWCGMQIQNIPRDRKDIQVKKIFVSDRGFLFGECDYEQAEARDVAYLSGDTNLINAVDDVTRDFHGTNASAFFGVPYEKIVASVLGVDGSWKHDTLDKDLRDLSKRTNHGANYNMGAGVMLDTMGIEKVLQAKKLLGLPERMRAIDVTTHLLNVYAKTYPVVKGAYYDKIKADVAGTKMLVGPTGWTRYCFGNPSKNKQDLNACVAHPSQSLNAMTLNIAWRKIFYQVWLPNQADFKLHAQIHDSILFSYREGREDLAWRVKELMEFDVPVKDSFGIVRQLRVPVALKGNGKTWAEVESLKKKAA
jgi:DNA polymerase I-like protein with 3'-5' exonuclease and polymerase domains